MLAHKFWGASNYCPSVGSNKNIDQKVVGLNHPIPLGFLNLYSNWSCDVLSKIL